MHDLKSTTNYNIFRCLSAGCTKHIPVESFLSDYNYSKGISYLQKEGIDLSHDLFSIDVTCPFCSHINHFRVMDRVREISKQEYDAQSHAVKSSATGIRYGYKVNTQAGGQSPHGLENIPPRDAPRRIQKANTSMPLEGAVFFNPPSIFEKYRGLERKEFKR
jgi:hypothetical protein